MKKLSILLISLLFTHAAYAQKITGDFARQIIIEGDKLIVSNDSEYPSVAHAHIIWAQDLFYCTWSFHHLKRFFTCEDNYELFEAENN